MNRTIAIAAIAAAFTGTAFAEDYRAHNPVFEGTQTRAEVQADFNAYRQAGVNPWSTSYNPLRDFQSQKSRAEVVSEYAASRDRVAAFTGEDSGSGHLMSARAASVAPVYGAE